MRADTLRFKRGFTIGQTAIGQVSGTGSIDEGNYGFWNDMLDSIDICFTVIDSFWNIDSIELSEIHSMVDRGFISITNCGNCHLTFGLDFLGDSLGWDIGTYSGPNKFTLRAQFNEDTLAPLGYDAHLDFIKDVVTWSSDIVFGPGGYDIAVEDFVHLWFCFLAPSTSTTFGNNKITIGLLGRSYLP